MNTYAFRILLSASIFLIALGISRGQSLELFDNETLDGWMTKGDLEVSFGDDEISLRAPSDPATLWSDFQLSHFILRGMLYLESGLEGALLFRQPDREDISGGYAISLNHREAQQNPTGSIIDVARGTWLARFDTAGWFPFVLQARGDHLMINIDGSIVAQTHDRRSDIGHLGFKIGTGSTLKLRDLALTKLTDPGSGLDIRNHFDSQPEVPFTHLFDGSTLEGWTNLGASTWDVEDGVLHGYSGETGGFLISDGAYKNFHLILDFRIIKEDNSGIFIRRPADAEAVTIQNSVECNIYDHNGYAHPYSTGSLATHARAWSNLISYEHWNTAEILAYEDQVAMYINGVKASHADLPQFNRAGNICLQAGFRVFHPDKGASDIYFRNIRIKSLD